MTDIDIRIYEEGKITFVEMMAIITYLKDKTRVSEEWIIYEEMNN